jgi:hypothetical protein
VNKHIWYRLEYKKVVDKFFKYVCWIGGATVALAFSSLAPESGSFFERVLTGLTVCGAFLLIICSAVALTLTQVDKHEWELSQNTKEETK